MDRDALARKIRDAIFDRAEADGRVMHGDSVVDVIKGVLAMEMAPQPPDQVYVWSLGNPGKTHDATFEYPHLLTIGGCSSTISGNRITTGNSIALTQAAGIAPVSAIPQDG